jgi:hypothetical protein
MRQDKITVVKPPVLPIFGRTLVLTIALLASVFAAACWSSKGLDWLLANSNGKSPVITCPNAVFTAKIGDGGDFCSMELVWAVDLMAAIRSDPAMNAYCIAPAVTTNPIVCKLPYSCDQACSFGNGVCPDPETVPQVTVYGQDQWMCNIYSPSGFNRGVECRRIELMPYCDSKFYVTPGAIVAIRGLIFGALLIVLIWFIAEFVLRAVDIGLRKDTAYGHLRQKETLPQVKAELRALIERRWAEQYEASRRETGMGYSTAGSTYGGETPRMSAAPSGAGTPRSAYGGSQAGGGYRSALESRNPQRRFESTAWQRRLTQWKELKSRKSSVYKSKVFLRSLGLNLLFLGTLVCTMFLIIFISPAKISGGKSIIDTLVDDISIWKIHSWLDALIFVDLLLDVLLFLIACCVVHWPRAPVFAKHKKQEQQRLEEGNAGSSENGTGSISLSMSGDEEELDDDLDDAFSLESVLKQTMNSDTCLMIACHQSTLTEEKEAAFTNTLKCALKVFPPSHIFVCDNGNSICPVDGTQAIAQSIHPDINYIYVPEGNKTFAFYWCNRYWVPFLAQCGRVPDFRYALITDDDVPLPADLHIPHEYLRLHPEVKAVHFAITAATPDGKPPLIVRCQDIEYKMAAVHKYFQSTLSRALSCHGAIALWERATLDRVFYDHDTVFHGEDLYMGLSLLRLRDDSRIISCPQTIVPTYAPDHWAMLFRQRVKSWELTSHKKTFTYLFEFLNPFSLCHAASLVLKPYFLQELLTIILDWLRMFLLTGLLLRDWIGFLLMTAVFTTILYFQVVILQFVYLRQRKDLRSSFFTVLAFPFYRLSGLLFRLCALCHNILVYSHERKSMKIGTREDEIRDVAPCPPHPDCDWFTVWQDVPVKDQQA